MLTLPLLRKMLNRAGTELKANSKYLCELDSVAGDGDHGITIGRMADVMKEKTEDTTIDTMRVLLDELGDAFMGINGGSAGPLWGTVFTGMAEGIDDQAELTDLELRKMFTQAKEDFMDIFGSYKYILDYDMVKIAFYREEVVGFFISVPNYANLPYKLNVRNFFKILQIKNKPDEYVMLYMGVDRRHLGLGNALSNVITMELKNKHVPSIGALVRDGKITQSYASELIRDRYEYVLLEKKL